MSAAVSTPAPPVRGGRWKALSVRNFRVYLAGSALSLSGGWLLRTAQSWLVLELTNSPAALGAVTACQFLPVTLLTLFAGVVIDRWRTRTVMVIVQCVIAAQATTMAVLILTNQIQFWEVLVLSAVQGAASAFDQPSRSAIVSELVEPSLVGNGIAVNSSLGSATRIIGPGIGGLMIALWGTGICFAVTSVGCIGSIAALLALRSSEFYPHRSASRGAVIRQLWEGVRYSFSTPTLGAEILLSFFIGCFAYNFATVLPLMAQFALNSGSEGFGALNMAMGAGSTIGALALATRVGTTTRRMFASGFFFSLLVFGIGLMPNMPAAMTELIVTGMLSVVFSAMCNTLLQTEAREDFRGRVLSLYWLMLSGTTPIGSAITGYLSDQYNIRLAVEVNGLVCLFGVVLAAVYLLLARRRAAALDPTFEPPSSGLRWSSK